MHDIPAIPCHPCVAVSHLHEDGLKKMKTATEEASWHSQCCTHEHVQCFACEMMYMLSPIYIYSKSCTPNALHEAKCNDAMTASERSQLIGTCGMVAQAMLEVVRHHRRLT